jgi:hypothetical protein
MTRACLIFLALHIVIASFAQTNDSVTSRIILVGDAGAFLHGRHPVVSAIKHHMHPDKKTRIVFLGDNVYRYGLPDDASVDFKTIIAVLDSQISVAEKTPAKVYMIPGNHDWENGGPYGYDALLRQQSYVNSLKDRNVQFVPARGCPGPVEIPVNDDVVMVMWDSQWWIHPYDKPGIESDCDCKTESEFITQLTDILRKNYDKLVILAAHHPFMSNGIHGGYFGVKQHIFPFTDLMGKLWIPLPVIGSIYPISRGVFGSPEDIQHPAYQNMITRVKAVAYNHPNLIFAAGHEHTLQLLKDDSGYNYIVSGAGCKQTRVANSKKSLFTKQAIGFAVLETSKNKNVRVSFYEVDVATETPKEIFSKNILDYSKLPPITKDTTTLTIPDTTRYIAAPASSLYKKASGFKRFLLGNNYRTVWSTPVQFKVFWLKKEKGGFEIESMGGGKQTKTLTLTDKKGKKWSLRTIDKDPEKVVPENLRNTIAADIVQDMISAAYPYAPLTVADLAATAHIPHAQPEFFFVPDDPAFGFYRPLFANKVCMLEPKDASVDSTDTKSTVTVFNNTIEENDHRVLQKPLLRARLLDMLVADWDRHLDQWKWGEADTGQGKLYYPIPKDRDQAFFRSDGVLLGYISRKILPFLKGFRDKIPDPQHLAMSAKDIDRAFLTELDKKDWDSAITSFTRGIPDSAIRQSVRKLPAEIYAIDGETITSKLISRRDHLPAAALKHYKFLAKSVNVLGSNNVEHFKVFDENDKIRVQVLAKIKEDTSFVMYDRLFDPGETKEIRLYGFNGNDVFQVDATKMGSTFIRVIGGKGKDSITVNGNIRNYIYDLSNEENHIKKGSKTKTRLSSNPRVNYFELDEYKYDIKRYPRLNVGFNGDDGLMVGLGVWYRKFAFRKTPYASDQRLTTLFALGQKAYQFGYRGIFNNVFNKLDVLVNGALVNPALNNFFGFGNNTLIDKSKDITYYRVRYSFTSADVLLRKRLANVLSIFAGGTAMHYWNKEKNNDGYVLAKPSVIGLDSLRVYSNKSYAGFKLGVLVNNLNNELFPTRGINWYTEFTNLQPLSDNAHSLTKWQSDMVVYSSLNDPAKLVSVLRLGGGHIWNRKFEYFQAMNLGANNFLRGFRKNRFSGNSLAYGSLELRYKLLESRSYVLPGAIGLVAFNDLGRVWLRGEKSNRWHYAYGGGFYYVPYNMLLVSATIAFSKEEQVFNFTLGTKLNLTF